MKRRLRKKLHLAKFTEYGCNLRRRGGGSPVTGETGMEEGERAPAQEHPALPRADEVWFWLQARPEGPRHFIEEAVQRAQGTGAPEPDWWFRHVSRMVAGAVRDVKTCHGEVLPGSVGKRVAVQLWQELFGGKR